MKLIVLFFMLFTMSLYASTVYIANDGNHYSYDATVAVSATSPSIPIKESTGYAARLSYTDAIPSAMVFYTASNYINAGSDTFYYAGHGFEAGVKVGLTTTGTLPTTLVTTSSYYIAPVDADNFKLFTTQAYALAATPCVDLTSVGTPVAAAHTITPEASGGNVKLQYSVDEVNWTDLYTYTSTTVANIAVTGANYNWLRLVTTATAGQHLIDLDINHK